VDALFFRPVTGQTFGPRCRQCFRSRPCRTPRIRVALDLDRRAFRPYLPLPGWGWVGGEVNDMWYWHGMGPWGWLTMIAFWAAVTFLIIWAVRSTATPGRREEDTPLRILDERLARGEIDLEDYEERRQVLESRR